ncbi:MAG: ROK family protein [Bacteroidales bacterium]
MSKDVVLGIDVGGTYTKYGLVDKSGRIHLEDSISTGDYTKIEDFIKALHHHLNAQMDRKEAGFTLKGIGIGAPNGNYYTGSIEYPPNLVWKGKIEFVKLIEKEFGVPAVLTNDANAAALGEMLFGGAKGLDHFIMITLGTGLGSGLVVNGEMVYGNDGFAGELGHIRAVDNGRQCGCGKRGCLETYVSATRIKRTVSADPVAPNRSGQAAVPGDWIRWLDGSTEVQRLFLARLEEIREQGFSFFVYLF